MSRPDVLVATALTGPSAPWPALGQVSLRVAAGELVAILGRSRSGRSALLGLCGGLRRPAGGQVVVSGIDLGALDEHGRRGFLQRTVGWVFQRPLLVPTLTVEENVAVAAIIIGDSESDALRAARLTLEAVGLSDRARSHPDQLSWGEQQRVALARALVKAPDLVIADDPTSQLDSWTGADVLSLLRDAARNDIAVLFTTQEEEEAATADRVYLLEDDGLRLVWEAEEDRSGRRPGTEVSSPA
ncbi:MAG TPA: ATP-binding cassette domain-containing protein [Candidatus Dormibacteraeota bacterium]|nr:ATP-binding cassette domain-containing protein [Candidatus Dormibacteraeota bacterium]